MAAQYELLKELLNSGTKLDFGQEMFFKFYQAFILNDRWVQYIQGVGTTLLVTAIALALGMAIDANVLINERIREELRNGSTPQAAIAAGYERAFDTILDSNITTLIAGLALLIFGSGPVRGFAVVHCLGILTSIFSAVVVSRALVNIIYGRQKRLTKISIGQVWKPETDVNNSTNA